MIPYFLLTLSALLWSGNFVLSRAVVTLIPPVGLLFWRWTVALAVLFPIVLPRLRRQWPLIRANLKLFPLYGLLGVTLFNLLIYTAMHTTTAINAALVNSAIPVLILFFSRIFYGQSVSGRQWIGIGLSLAGVATIILRGDPSAALHLSFTTGDLLVLAAAASWALYSVGLRYYPQGLDPLVFLFVIALFGLAFIAPLYALEIASGKVVEPTPATLASIAYVGIFASVIAFVAWNSGIRRVGAQAGGQFIHLMPAFSTLLAVLFLHERLLPFHAVGIGLIVAGILFATLRPKS
ncbi:MAG TPA: DMT family transporter [Desulfuromonadales bacterium]|nr:DMT family transporter [Desulfuromonadales bacterium]